MKIPLKLTKLAVTSTFLLGLLLAGTALTLTPQPVQASPGRWRGKVPDDWRRVWPSDAPSRFCRDGSWRKCPNFGLAAATWINYGGSGSWKVYKVKRGVPLKIATHTDRAAITRMNYDIYDWIDGRWRKVIKVRRGYWPGAALVKNYKPKGSKLKVAASGWGSFYVDIFQERTEPLPGRQAKNLDARVKKLWRVHDGVLDRLTGARGKVAYISGLKVRDFVFKVRIKSKGASSLGLSWHSPGFGKGYSFSTQMSRDPAMARWVVRGKKAKVLRDTRRKGLSCPPSEWGSWHTCKVVADGNHFKMYRDGKKVFEGRDDTITGAGRLGIGSNSRIWIDYILVKDLEDNVIFKEDFEAKPLPDLAIKAAEGKFKIQIVPPPPKPPLLEVNRGKADAGPHIDVAKVSRPVWRTIRDKHEGLPAGGSRPLSEIFREADLPPGTHKVEIILDRYNYVRESNERNNRWKGVIVIGRDEIEIARIRPPAGRTLKPGSQTFDLTVRYTLSSSDEGTIYLMISDDTNHKSLEWTSSRVSKASGYVPGRLKAEIPYSTKQVSAWAVLVPRPPPIPPPPYPPLKWPHDRVKYPVKPVNRPPIAKPGGPYPGKVKKWIKLDGTGSCDRDEGGKRITAYRWDFEGAPKVRDGNSARPKVKYSSAGEYVAKLKVRDDEGDWSSWKSTTIRVGPAFIPGDVNQDGEVTAADATLILRHAVGLIKLKGKHFKAADVAPKGSPDGRITTADATLILRAIIGLIRLG